MHIRLAARLNSRGDGSSGGGSRQRRNAPVGPAVARDRAEPGDAVGELDAGFQPLVWRGVGDFSGCGGSGSAAEVEEQAGLVVLC